jgi:hypothetical protein
VAFLTHWENSVEKVSAALGFLSDVEGLEKVTRGVNGSQSKFLYKNWPMSQVQTPKPKPYKKVMNTPTNSIEMTPLKVMNAAEKEWDQLDTW